MRNVRKALVGLLFTSAATAGLAQPGAAQDPVRTCKGHVATDGVTIEQDLSELTAVELELFYQAWVDGDVPGGQPGLMLVGTDGDDVILGTGRNDVILPGMGDDVICGFAGHDAIAAASGGGRVYLGPGDDAFFRSYGSFARVHGGPGNDFIEAGNDDMVIRGGQGDDFLLVTQSAGSVIRGGPGNDEIYQWSGRGTNRIYGGPGGDRLNIGLGSATVLGGLGPDLIVNSQDAEPSVLRGGSGQDWIQSVEGDTVRGGPGVDTCAGRACEIEPDVGELPDFARPIAWWN